MMRWCQSNKRSYTCFGQIRRREYSEAWLLSGRSDMSLNEAS